MENSSLSHFVRVPKSTAVPHCALAAPGRRRVGKRWHATIKIGKSRLGRQRALSFCHQCRGRHGHNADLESNSSSPGISNVRTNLPHVPNPIAIPSRHEVALIRILWLYQRNGSLPTPKRVTRIKPTPGINSSPGPPCRLETLLLPFSSRPTNSDSGDAIAAF